MPTCTLCPAAAVVHLRYAGTSLCAGHFKESFLRRAKQEVAKQGRLPKGVLAVALSGGKDSVAALHVLDGLAQGHRDLRLVALTVDEGIAGYRDASLASCRRVTSELGIEWRTVRTADLSGYSIDDYAAGRAGPKGDALDGVARPACGPCGVYRRAGLNRLAKEVGAAAVATGHNLDDMAQTVLMNHLRGDLPRLARLAPHDPAHAQPGLVPRLMPFRSIPEKEVLLYAVLEGLPFHGAPGAGPGEGGGTDECPYAARSHRFALRDVLVRLEEQTPGTRHALVKGHERLKPILLAGLPAERAGACATCGEPTSGGDGGACMACALRA